MSGRAQWLLCESYQLNQGMGEWTSVLHEIAEQLKGNAVALVRHDFLHNRATIYDASGYDHKYLRSYPLRFSHRNPWLAHESDYRPPGKIHLGEQLVPEPAFMRTAMYNEWLRPQNLHHRLCAVLSRDGDTTVFLEVLRSREAGPFTQNDIDVCRSHIPRLQHLLSLHQRIADLEAERDAALRTLDYLPWGVILVDNRSGRLASNRRAQEILSARDGLMVHGDILRAVLADESARLDRLLSSAIKEGSERGGGSLSITRPLKTHPLSVVVISLRQGAEGPADPAPAAAIFVSDPDIRLDGNEQHLRDVYALTAVEARLATQLSEGKSVEEAAAEMSVTVNTARAYLKRIYSKIGVRRQSELMRRLLLGVAGLGPIPNEPTDRRRATRGTAASSSSKSARA